MRRLRPLLLVAALACSATLSADQKDGDLPDLFGKLKQADSPQQAVMIEAEIWKKWYEREGPVGGDSMAEVVEAMSAGRYTLEPSGHYSLPVGQLRRFTGGHRTNTHP